MSTKEPEAVLPAHAPLYPADRAGLRSPEGDPFARRSGSNSLPRLRRRARAALSWTLALLLPLLFLAASRPASASQAYGSINNFDTVNDTGSVCHGFEIEIDDIHSKDITYTYDYNHYGVPVIREDNANPLHPKVFVRYQSIKNPDGTWASYTAIPSAPIPPTAGHQFTNPSLNFGGEHFGVGFYGTPTAIVYSWLKDDGAGNLVFAGAVNISTPAFTYIPPVGNVAAVVQAAIVPPPPPAPPILEFGPASWVKETRTTSHKNNKVELKDLVSDDPNDPNAKSWRNGEPDEVEVEWQILQTDFNAGNGGKNGELVGAGEGLPHGDEVVTRRYDFFKYTGPLDPETGEAVADSVGKDGIHGVGQYANTVVVGDYVGAQMAGFDAGNKIGLIDHLQDGEINTPYVERTIVIGGAAPILTKRTGALPDGMKFDEVTGVLSGTPTVSGKFTFTIDSTDANNANVTATYTLNIADAGVVVPANFIISTAASPSIGGIVTGAGQYASGAIVTVTATANPGFAFVNWTDSGVVVNVFSTYQFTASENRLLVANFTRTVLDVTSKVIVTTGGFRLNRANGHYVQQVTVKNTSQSALTGPVSLVLDSLSANAALANKSGVTAAIGLAGSPYVDVAPGNLPAGASVTFNLEFANPTNKGITYAKRVLAGPGPR